jgi:hypothetical protein
VCLETSGASVLSEQTLMESILDRVGTSYPWTYFEITVGFLSARCGTLNTLFEHLVPYISKTNVSEIELDTSTWKLFWRSLDFGAPGSEKPLDPAEGVMPSQYNDLVHKIGQHRAPWFFLSRFAEDPAGLLAEIFADIPQEVRLSILKSDMVTQCPVDAAHVLLSVASASDFGQTNVLSNTETPGSESSVSQEASAACAPPLLAMQAPRVVTRKTFYDVCRVPVHASKKNKCLLLFTSRQKECATIWGWRFPSFEFYCTSSLFQLLDQDFIDFVECGMVDQHAPVVDKFRATLSQMLASEDLVGLDINAVAALMLASFEPNRVDAWRALGFAIDSTAARKAVLFTQSNPNARVDLLTHLAAI